MKPRTIAPLAVALALVGFATGAAFRPLDPPALVEIAYSPAANLERADVALIDEAKTTLDIAAYSLTSHAVVEAIGRALDRGVRVRLLIDASQAGRNRLEPIAGRAEVREWGPAPLMHLKAFVVDGAVLRDGSANFSPSGLKSQLNSRIVIRDRALVGAFVEVFAREWSRSKALP